MALDADKVNEIWLIFDVVFLEFDKVFATKNFRTSEILEWVIEHTSKYAELKREEIVEAWLLLLLEEKLTEGGAQKVANSP